MASFLNSTIQPLLADKSFSGTYEKLGINVESISVVIKSDVAGSLKIIFADNPQYPAIFTHNYDYDPSQEFHRVVSKKGQYLKVQYTNGPTNQTSLQLKTYLKNDFEVEQTTEGGNDVNITNEYVPVQVDNDITVTGLNFNESGELLVTSAPMTGYATSQNQTTQLEKAESTNQLLTQIKEDQAETGEIILGIESLMTPIKIQKSYANILTDAATLGADTNPSFTISPTGLNGWYYRNSALNGGSNLYFYGKTTQTRQATYTISEITNSYVVCKIFNLQATNNLPFLVKYSAPTGSGDYQPWYKSKWVYTLPSSIKLDIGSEILIYWGTMLPTTLYPHLTQIQATLSAQFGPCQDNENLLFLTVNTDSAATLNSTQVLYSLCGYTTLSSGHHELELSYGIQDKYRGLTTEIQNLNSNISSGVFQQLDGNISGQKWKSTRNDGSGDVNVVNNIVIDSSDPINSLMLAKYQDNNVLLQVNQNGELLVSSSGGSTGYPDVNLKCNDVLLTQTPSGTKNCLDVEVNNMINIDTLATEQTVSDINATLSKLSFDENNILLVSGNVKAQEVPITYTQTAVDKFSLDVNVNNITGIPVTGTFYQETQPVSIQQLSFTGQNELIVYDSKITKCDTDNIAGSINVLNFPITQAVSGTFWQETQPVSISGTIPISSASALDIHMYASSNGSTWHHVASDSNGQLNVHSKTQDGAGNDITSTLNGTTRALDVKLSTNPSLSTSDNGLLTSTLSGTGNSIHSLDVAVKNNVSIQNTNSTPIITAPRNSLWQQVANNLPSVFGPSQIGSTVDTDGYTYILAYITFGLVTAMGNIYCEFSPDGTTWIRTYYSTYLNVGSNVTGTISIGNSMPFKYYRLYADTGFGGSTCNAWFAMK